MLRTNYVNARVSFYLYGAERKKVVEDKQWNGYFLLSNQKVKA